MSADVRAAAIPRLDPQGHGIHVAWSGPDLLPLAIGGYEVRRRIFSRDKTSRTCVTFDAQQLDALERIGYQADDLGTILCRTGTWPAGTSVTAPRPPVLPPVLAPVAAAHTRQAGHAPAARRQGTNGVGAAPIPERRGQHARPRLHPGAGPARRVDPGRLPEQARLRRRDQRRQGRGPSATAAVGRGDDRQLSDRLRLGLRDQPEQPSDLRGAPGRPGPDRARLGQRRGHRSWADAPAARGRPLSPHPRRRARNRPRPPALR